MKTAHLLITCAATLLSLPACATKREVPFRTSPGAPFTDKLARFDYSTFEKMPDTPTSAVYRVVLKAMPYTRANAFYGNWAGNGCCGGRPVDAVDEIFRRHDIAYAEAKTIRTMSWADKACVEALAKLDERTLSPEAIAFCDRSSSFFSNRALTLVGKPVSAVLRRSESKDCPFQTEGDVRALFGLNESKVTAPEKRHSPPALLAAKKPGRSHAAASRKALAARWLSSVRSRLLASQDRPLPSGSNEPGQ